jgi:uncharacterized protein (TIGR03437 family)
MTQRKRILYAKMAVILASIPALVFAYEYGPPPGHTAAPGDDPTACIDSGCHVGTPNSGPGNVKMFLPAGNQGTYVPGQAMQILVQITDATKVAYGFQLTARQGSGNLTQSGDFTTTDANTQVLCADDSSKNNGALCPTAAPMEYIEHTLTGYEASIQTTTKGSYTYSFSWTPPAAGSGNVTLYVAANCGIGNPPEPTPTDVYTSNITLTPSAATAPTPSINAGGIGPIYSKATTIQPGSWISIYGTNLVSSLGVWNGSPPTPTTLGGASVTINGKPAYLWVAVPDAFGTTDQINAQAPDDTATGTVTVTVTNATNGTATSTVTLGNVGPSFSVLGDAADHAAAVILTPNGTGAYGGGSYDIDGPAGTSLGYPTRPVKAGEIVLLYGVGFGPTSPAIPAGLPYSGPANGAPTTDTVTLTIGGVPVPQSDVLFSGIVGQGLYQITITVPSGLGTGDQALLATVAGVTTPTGVVLALQ